MRARNSAPQNNAHNNGVLSDTLLPIGISYTKIALRTSTKKVPLGGYNDDNGRPRRHPCQCRLSLDSASDWRRLHGDERQSTIRMDVLRPRHSKAVRLGSRFDPVGFHTLRPFRNLARAG